jgi:hypothetical protein
MTWLAKIGTALACAPLVACGSGFDAGASQSVGTSGAGGQVAGPCPCSSNTITVKLRTVVPPMNMDGVAGAQACVDFAGGTCCATTDKDGYAPVCLPPSAQIRARVNAPNFFPTLVATVTPMMDNPLALPLVSTSIADVFAGSVQVKPNAAKGQMLLLAVNAQQAGQAGVGFNVSMPYEHGPDYVDVLTIKPSTVTFMTGAAIVFNAGVGDHYLKTTGRMCNALLALPPSTGTFTVPVEAGYLTYYVLQCP